MKSRTSSSKLRVFKKDLTRYAPVWVEYSVILLILFYFLWNDSVDIIYNSFLSVFAWINALYGFVCAVTLFGYLTDPRECNTVHAFPIRREAYFGIHLCSGLLMALVPNLVFSLLNIPLVDDGNVLVFFAGTMLQFLFFYGLAIFCMFLTGRKFAAGTLYGLLNVLSLLIYAAMETIYLPMLPGVVLNSDGFFNFCPVLRMSFSNITILESWYGQSSQQVLVTGIYALIGLGLMGLSLVLYRKRRLEYAGDFLAVKWLSPVFVAAVSLACGCALAAFGSLLTGSYLLLLAIGLIVGWFTGKMLLHRTIKVFDRRSIVGVVAVLAVMFGSIFATKTDPLNWVGYIPDTQDVASVEIRRYEREDNRYESDTPEVIADVLALHEAILEQEEFTGLSGINYYVTYTLDSGRKVSREYTLNTRETTDWGFYYYSQPEYLLDVETLAELKEKCSFVCVRNNTQEVVLEAYDEFLEVFYRESTEGKMGNSNVLSSECFYLEIMLTHGSYIQNGYTMYDTEYYYIPVPYTAVDTLELCRQIMAEAE